MKRLIFISICLCALVACERDFDELNDTNLRHIDFEFNTDELFSSILQYDGNSFEMMRVDKLPVDCRVRITAYCYNQQDSLLSKESLFAPFRDYKRIRFKHLDKNLGYKFLFVADVVRYNSDVDYYETWFQMKVRSLNEAYFYSDQRSDNYVHNILGQAIAQLTPANQTHMIEFTPLTYNGYCVFRNANTATLFSGHVSYSVSFVSTTLERLYYGSVGYEFSYLNPTEQTIVMPITFCVADDAFDVYFKTKMLDIEQENKINIENHNHRPFVMTFDCSTLQQTESKFY